MTRINFYQTAESANDALSVACRLAEKAWLSGMDVLLYSEDSDVAAAVGRQLWHHSATSFLASDHLATLPANTTPATIGICGNQDPGPYRGLLINLEMTAPPWFGRFEVLAEIIYPTGDARAGKRQRYRYYKDRGYPLSFHDLTPKQMEPRQPQ